MEAILDLFKTFAIGAGAGILFALIVKGNQYKQKKEKEKNLKN